MGPMAVAWHKNFGHIATPSLERLHRENMVNRMIVDQSSIPLKSCDICIQAKQARRSYDLSEGSRTSSPRCRRTNNVRCLGTSSENFHRRMEILYFIYGRCYKICACPIPGRQVTSF